MCLGGRQSTPAPTNVKDNSMYYNGNVFDPIPEEELETGTGDLMEQAIRQSDAIDPVNSSGLSIADANNGSIRPRDLSGN
tara:strand:+ start:201 stop:440 length:240 start_codon:yes stop_codon:yes gene_type:complete